MDVVVTGIGLHSCLGSLTDSWQSLGLGKSGIRLMQPFPELPPYPLGMIGNSPASLDDLTKIVVESALEDAGLTIPLNDCGVVIGSSRGCQATWEDLATQYVTDFNWLDSLPHRGAVLTARLIKTNAPVLSPMAACATGIHALARAYELIQTGRCQRVIAGAVEAPITRLSLAGFERLGALATTGCYPFDTKREGLVLGEGGAVFILESATLAKVRKARIYGKILGLALTCDAQGLTAPESNSRSAAIAIKQCLERSKLTPDEINYIHLHGTSTKLNDLHEAKLVEQLFPSQIPVSSTKGATGHSLGASGAIGVAFCLLALQSGYLPPCVGLKDLAFPLNAVINSYSNALQNALCFSFGFGGQNAILAIGKSS
ncbi:MAG: beta-ketoacyl-ACP synthase [Xenococcus sp. (in: cyanobacteria)]